MESQKRRSASTGQEPNKKVSIADLEETGFFIGKKSTANTKMVAYLDELLKNKFFVKKLKLIDKDAENKKTGIKFARLYPLVDEYVALKRAMISGTKNDYERRVEDVIGKYGISYESIILATEMMKGNYDYVKYQKHDVHLCTINEDYINFLFPLNPADDFVHYNLSLKRRILAYPISIGISPRATKSDVLDFIDKNWWWIKHGDAERGLKPLRIRKRKHEKGLIDLIWKNRGLKLKSIKATLDKEFPKNTLTYNEIQDLITYEKKGRLKKLT